MSFFSRSLQYLEARSEVTVALNLATSFNQLFGDQWCRLIFQVPQHGGAMIDIGFSRHLKIKSCYSRRIKELSTDDYPGNIRMKRSDNDQLPKKMVNPI